MKKILLISIFSFTSPVFACEPASIDWKSFYKNYDQNYNKFIEQNEFVQVQNFSPYDWVEDKRFKGKDKNIKLFTALDKNKDGKLSEEELWQVQSLLPNPCAGWPWSKGH